MKSKSFDEFESLFERASIPVFDIPPLALQNIAVVLEGGALDNSMLELANHLATRFQADCIAYRPGKILASDAEGDVRKHHIELASQCFEQSENLAGQLNDAQTRLVIYGAGEGSESAVDSMVFGCDAPILILRQPVADPGAVFQRVLHSLTGNLTGIRNLAYSFNLVASSGELVLMHTIEEEEIDEVRDTLRVSPGISDASGDELVADLTCHAERFLKGMVEASRDEPYEVSYRLGVGDVLNVVQYELSRENYSLLVLGTHEAGKSRIDAEEYRLMHMAVEIPVLAL